MGLLLAHVPANSPFFFNKIFIAIPPKANESRRIGNLFLYIVSNVSFIEKHKNNCNKNFNSITNFKSDTLEIKIYINFFPTLNWNS